MGLFFTISFLVLPVLLVRKATSLSPSTPPFLPSPVVTTAGVFLDLLHEKFHQYCGCEKKESHIALTLLAQTCHLTRVCNACQGFQSPYFPRHPQSQSMLLICAPSFSQAVPHLWAYAKARYCNCSPPSVKVSLLTSFLPIRCRSIFRPQACCY